MMPETVHIISEIKPFISKAGNTGEGRRNIKGVLATLPELFFSFNY
jgi:hypothetical protein